MAILWPTHRVKAAQAKAARRRLRRQASAEAKAAYAEQRRRATSAP